MPLPKLVIAQKDPVTALQLEDRLRAHYARVTVADTVVELRRILSEHKARVAIIDLAMMSIEDVRKLSQSDDEYLIVCTHPFPNEQIRTAALDAGASGLCSAQDIRSILRATLDAALKHWARRSERELVA